VSVDAGNAALQIDRKLLPAKVYYFFSYAALAAFSPFLPLHYRSLGLNGAQIGLLTGLVPLVGLVCGPIWAGLADARRQHRLLLIVTMAAGVASTAALMVAPTFAWIVPIVVLRSGFTAPSTSLIDKSVLDMLRGRTALYGRQRLWGAVGWAIASGVVGLLTERLGLRWLFYAHLGLSLGAVAVALRLPITSASPRQSYRRGLALMLSNRRWAAFLFTVFIAGAGGSAAFSFLFLHLSDLGAPNSLMGLAMTIGALSEVPTFFYANVMLRRWGPRGLPVLGMVSSMVRLLVLSMVRTPWAILPLQLLYGPAFSAMWSGGVAYAHELAPEGMGATAQAVYGAFSMGLAHIAGAALGGLLYDRLGGHALFGIGAGVVAVALVFFWTTDRQPTSP